MRKKRKKRRHSTIKKHIQENIIYNFTNLQIISTKTLEEEQLTNIASQLENVILTFNNKPNNIIVKKIIVELNQYISYVKYNDKIHCFMVGINEEYFD